MRRRYQLGGIGGERRLFFASPPRSFVFDVRAYMKIYTFVSRKQVFKKTFIQITLLVEILSPVHGALRRRFLNPAPFRTRQRDGDRPEYPCQWHS